MSSTPDPKIVREIARKFLTDPDVSADELDYVVRSYIGYASGAEHTAWRDAVRADADDAEVVTIASWPDEQPQEFECEVCTKPITAYPCALCEHEPDPWNKCGRPCAEMHTYEPGQCELGAKQADQPPAEQGGDVRAVAELPAMGEKYLDRLAGLVELPCSCGVADCEIYTSALTRDQARELVAEARRARAALDARDADGSAS